MASVLKIAGVVLLLLIILAALAVTIVPRFLDRVYYRGPESDHFDGARFFNPDGDADTAGVLGGSRAAFFWNALTGRDGRPAWPKSIAVTPVAPPARVEGERMVVTWVGHATVLIQTQGLNILTDPVWADNAGPLGTGPRRVAVPGIALDALPKIDLVLVSHNHYDHLDLKTLGTIWRRDRPRIVTSLGNDSVIAQSGAEATAVDWGQRVTIRPGIDVVVTRNHHWGSRWFTDRNRALWSSFVVTLPGGNLFFAGDTGWGDGKWIAEAKAFGAIRLALIPIGAFRFVPGQMSSGSHIGPAEAALIYAKLGASRAVPIHWGTFRLSFEAYDTPPKILAEAMRCGWSGRAPESFAPIPIGQPQEVAAYTAPVVPPAAVARPEPTRESVLACLDTPAVREFK